MKVIYKAEDGTEFNSEALCKEHEASQTIEAILSDLHENEVKAALAYETDQSSRQIGAAIEKAARIIAQARIAAGDAKRKRKVKPPEVSPIGVITTHAKSA